MTLVNELVQIGLNSDFTISRDHGKIPCVHHVYELVDDKSLSWAIYISKIDGKNYLDHKRFSHIYIFKYK